MLEYREVVYSRYASVVKRYPKTWDERAANSWASAFKRYLSGWLPDDRNARIVDLGCGSGRFLHLLRKLGYSNVTGIDISSEQVELARQIHHHVVEGDALEFLMNSNERFDLLVALDFIEHLTKQEATKFLQLAEERLNPGGRLIMNSPNAASPFFGTRRYGDFTHEIAFSPSCLGHVLELFGFTGTEARELGPYSHGVRSAIRSLLWQAIRYSLQLYHLIEVGHTGDGVFTRDFLITGVKPVVG